MKFIKRLFYFLLMLLFLFVGALIAIPYFFKDKIIARAKTEMNNKLNAKADFGDLNISLIRSFPNVSLSLNDITVDGVDEFEGLRLAEIDKLRLTADVMSVIKDDRPIEVKSFVLDGADIHVKILKNGQANYDIIKINSNEKETDTSDSNFNLSLKKYALKNSHIIYDDAASNTYAEVSGLNHEGKGDFTATIYDLVTQTEAQALSVKNGGITYISKAETNIDLTLNADMNSGKYSISDNDIRLNDLELSLIGWVAPIGDDIDMHLKFNTPQNDFKHLLSMVPGAYIDNFRKVKTEGEMALSGTIKGTYSDSKMPTLDLKANIQNASFQYPELPMGMKDINAKASIKSPGSDLDEIVVDVPTFHFKLGDNPFDLIFNLRTPMSDPQVKARAKGKIGLTDLSKAFPMEGVKTLTGLIDADVDVDTRMSYIENSQYEKVNMKGDLSIMNLNYDATNTPLIIVKNAKMNFTPQQVNIPSFDALLGKSDVEATGEIDNVLAYFSPKKTMKGVVTIQSDLLDIDQWMTDTKITQNDPVHDDVETQNHPVHDDVETQDFASLRHRERDGFDRYNFDIDADFKRIKYDKYELTNTKALGNFTPEKINLTQFETQMDKSDIRGTSTLENVMDYVFNNETLRGNIDIQSNTFDVNPFINDDSHSMTVETQNFASLPSSNGNGNIPDRFDVTFNADAKEVFYDIYTLKNMKAKGNFTPEKLTLNSFSTNIGKSDMSGSGALENVMNYVYKNEVISGNFDLKSRLLNVDDLYGEETTETNEEESASVYPLPENMNIKFTADIDEVLYDNMTFENMKGDMTLNNESLNIKDFAANTLKGDIGLSGVYSTLNAEKPVFDFKYKMNKIDFGESFNTFASVEVIAPIMEFVEGIFSTEMNFKGELNPDMSLDYNTLTAEGLIHTLNAVVKNFEPLAKLSDKLNMKDLSKFEIKDTKNWFDITDGQFVLRPFTNDFKDIKMKGEGQHALTAENMNYKMNFTVPREKLDESAAGSAANRGIGLLSEQAKKIGVTIGESDNVNFDVTITGSHKKPKFEIKFLSASGRTVKEEVKEQVKEVVEEKVEAIETKAEEIVEEKKEKATKVVEQQLDTIQTKVEEKVDKVVEKATEEVKDKVGEAVGTVVDSLVTDKIGDKVNDKVEEVLGDKAKEELEKWKDKIKLPKFGKKKKDDDGN